MKVIALFLFAVYVAAYVASITSVFQADNGGTNIFIGGIGFHIDGDSEQ